MSSLRCPGQDSRYWKPEDVFECPCPACGKLVEFFKDEREVKCRGCGTLCRNPRLDLGCLAWCKHAEECRPLLEGRTGTDRNTTQQHGKG